MQIDLTTPALLFSTISLLLLAFTNRFLGLAKTIRELYSDYQDNPQKRFIDQIKNLRQRVHLIRNMQMLGAGSLLLCTLSMLFVFAGQQPLAMLMFAVSLILMVLALALSIVEIFMSVGALNVHLSDMEQALASDDKPVQGWNWLWRRLGRVSLTSLVWLSVVLALLILWLRDHWELQRLTDGPTVGGASWSIQQTISPPQGMIAVKQQAGRSQDLADNEEREEGPNDEQNTGQLSKLNRQRSAHALLNSSRK